MRVKLTRDCSTTQGFKKAGTEIEHPDAGHLVRLKVATAVDDEAIAFCKALGLNSRGEPIPPSTPRGAAPATDLAPERRPAPPPPVITEKVEIPKLEKPDTRGSAKKK